MVDLTHTQVCHTIPFIFLFLVYVLACWSIGTLPSAEGPEQRSNSRDITIRNSNSGESKVSEPLNPHPHAQPPSMHVAGKCSYPIILLTISNYLAVKAAGDKFPPRPACRYHQPDMSFT